MVTQEPFLRCKERLWRLLHEEEAAGNPDPVVIESRMFRSRRTLSGSFFRFKKENRRRGCAESAFAKRSGTPSGHPSTVSPALQGRHPFVRIQTGHFFDDDGDHPRLRFPDSALHPPPKKPPHPAQIGTLSEVSLGTHPLPDTTRNS